MKTSTSNVLKPSLEFIISPSVPSNSTSSSYSVASPHPVSARVVDLIEERAQGERKLEVFGTETNVYKIGHETLLPSYFKSNISNPNFRVKIGSSHCKQPYSASIYNGSALSFGPLGKTFILALNKAAREGGFFQNTGEVGISPYHLGIDVDIEAPDYHLDLHFEALLKTQETDLVDAGDIVWEIGNGYFACRDADGNFSPEQFKQKVQFKNVKMVELKLSQGMEPNKSLPVKKLTRGLAQVLGVKIDEKVALPEGNKAFSTPLELVGFISQLRELSNGKPIGIKLSIGQKHQFIAICKAMLKKGIVPDFITIDGMEGGTTGSPKGAAGYTGTPLDDALVFAHNTLVGMGLRDEIKIIASGKIFTERDIISKLVRGADLCSTARGLLLAAGCNQQRECYKGTCLIGIATQDKHLLENLDLNRVAQKIQNFHKITLLELAELVSIVGLRHPNDIQPGHIEKRINLMETKPLSQLYTFLKPNALLHWLPWKRPQSYQKNWSLADPRLSFLELSFQGVH